MAAANDVPRLSAKHRVKAVLRRSQALRKIVAATRHRHLDAEDVFIASYPRSGNTWLRFLLADLATGSPANFENVDRLIPAVGAHRAGPKIASSHRLIKTHETYRRDYLRAAYIVRDVRDVVVSLYRVMQFEADDLSGLDRFVDDFVSGRASPYGSWQGHVRDWLQAASCNDGIRVYRFEELRADPVAGLEEITHFVGIPADEACIERALARNSPDRMRELEHAGSDYLRRVVGYRSRGVRQGRPGGWRDVLTDRHLHILGPALALNAQLGYGA